MSKPTRRKYSKIREGQLLPDEVFAKFRLGGSDTPWSSPYCLSGYQSGGPHLPLKGFLGEAKECIRRHYERHIEPRSRVPYVKFWGDVRQVRKREGLDRYASVLAMRIDDSASTGLLGFGPLYVAGAFYFEALQASRRVPHDPAWAALLMCHHFLGMARGLESTSKRSSTGGKKTAGSFAEFNASFRAGLLSWLQDLIDHPTPPKLPTREAVIGELLPQAIAFRDKWSDDKKAQGKSPNGRSSALGVLMRDLTNDPDVRAAFEAVMGRSISRGRPPRQSLDQPSKKAKKRSSQA